MVLVVQMDQLVPSVKMETMGNRDAMVAPQVVLAVEAVT